MKTPLSLARQRGFNLIEMLIAVGITMFMVTAAGYVYLGTRETQRAIDRASSSVETGAFALQILGRDVMNAGFYPAVMPPISIYSPTMRRIDGYPPTDFAAPMAYSTGVFGCDGAKFNPLTSACDTAVTGAPDSIVINYFTNEAKKFAGEVGQRRDCTGSDVDSDPLNAARKLNSGGPPASIVDPDLAPQQPLFVSNRYALSPTTTAKPLVIEGQTIDTNSLACSGNGGASYQPLLIGLDDLQFTYGVFNTEATRAPDKFYTATEVNNLLTVSIDGVPMSPWARVSAVRVCLMTRTLGGSAKIADKAGALRTYLDCADQTITQAATDPSIRKRHVQVFGVRNKLNQGF